MCYDVLQTKWLAWSNGYVVPIERTTLRGSKIFAAIAGQDLTVPAKGQDAIWHFVFKARGHNIKPKFRAKQLQLTLAIDYEEFAQVELRREELNEVTGSDVPTKVSKYNPVLFMYHSLRLQ
jgi:hypothetical protein